jgi:hypothetical protein
MKNLWATVLVLIALGFGCWIGYWHGTRDHEAKHGPIGSGDDPPIVVHGGSFHVTLKRETYDESNKQFTVAAGDLSKFDSNGYGKGATLPPNWKEIRMCTDDTCQHGVYLDPGASNTVIIKLVSLADFVAKGGTNKEGSDPQTDYEMQGNNLGEFYPKNLMIFDAANTQTTYACTPVSKVDWSNCWIQVGVVK